MKGDRSNFTAENVKPESGTQSTRAKSMPNEEKRPPASAAAAIPSVPLRRTSHALAGTNASAPRQVTHTPTMIHSVAIRSRPEETAAPLNSLRESHRKNSTASTCPANGSHEITEWLYSVEIREKKFRAVNKARITSAFQGCPMITADLCMNWVPNGFLRFRRSSQKHSNESTAQDGY
jgi:hypothetical protein